MTKPETQIELDRGSIFFRCVEDSNDTVMLTDTLGQLVYVNKAWQNVYGYSWEEAIGKNPRVLRSRHQNEEFYKAMWREIIDPSKGHWKGELVNLAKNGTEVPVFLTITPFRNEQGTIQGYMGIALDITEKKRLEAQVFHQDRLAAIGLIASGLAHEIGTPLGVIRGRAEYLSMLLGDNQTMGNNLSIIVTQIDRISKLIYSLLNLARETHTDEIRPVQVKEVLDQVAVLMNPKVKQIKAVLTCLVPSTIYVSGETAKLEQVFLNLVVNAVHAIESAIEKGRNGFHEIVIACEDQDQFWQLSLSDTGCGISNDHFKDIFQPFFTTKPAGEGTGLGLAITNQIIRSWGGTIEVDSKLGEGSIFKILLPKALIPNQTLVLFDKEFDD